MDISKLCYELYKIDWKHSHGITKDREMDSLKNYFEDVVFDDEYSYESYLEDFGYEGQLYVCFDEFYDNEFQDEEYMCELLDNEKLIDKYRQHIVLNN
jgi:hypothetical protein